jgi:hypothetical protein
MGKNTNVILDDAYILLSNLLRFMYENIIKYEKYPFNRTTIAG